MSSSEDDTEKFAECIYNVVQNKSKHSDQLKSNRVLPEEQKQYDPKNLRVSASFQKHVSKHLEALLDNTKFIDVQPHKKRRKEKKGKKKIVVEERGLVLLSTSSGDVLVTDVDECTDLVPKKKRIQSKPKINDLELLKRAKEIAVTSDFILNKEETKHWAPETKGILEIVKLNK